MGVRALALESRNQQNHKDASYALPRLDPAKKAANTSAAACSLAQASSSRSTQYCCHSKNNSIPQQAGLARFQPQEVCHMVFSLCGGDVCWMIFRRELQSTRQPKLAAYV